MAEVKVYNTKGNEAGTIKLDDELFGVAVKASLIHEVIVAQDANSRQMSAHVKDRSQVSGTGKKPWKQKGTGRARHGSARSPIWSGGGVTFGPNALRNFFKKINKKVRRKAIAMVLSDRAKNDAFIVLEQYGMDSAKTSDFAKIRKALPGAGKSTLVVTTENEQSVVKAAKNLPKTTTISAKSLNARDLAKHPFIIASKDAIDVMTLTYKA